MNKDCKNRSIDIVSEPLPSVSSHVAINHLGQEQEMLLVREQPLTIYLNRLEIVTVMTMGSTPVYLVIGFLLNQSLISSIDDVYSVHIDWTVNAAAVYARQKKTNINSKKWVVTSGCGQGTMFSSIMNIALEKKRNLSIFEKISNKVIYNLLQKLSADNHVYKRSGGVHSCALCSRDNVIKSIEDVGRHNAMDSLAGFLVLEEQREKPTIMYTTGRLTSEMVIKTAQMGLSIIISRSGATSMGVDVANMTDITLISRAKGRRFIVLTKPDRIRY